MDPPHVQFVFEAYAFDPVDRAPRLLHTMQEDCHVDIVRCRAAAILWSLPLAEVQDLVVVRRVDTGQEVFRKVTGTSRHAWPSRRSTPIVVET